MPKIYGKVQYKLGNLACTNCGFEWKPTEDELDDIRNKRKVTCLFCRAMNELHAGEYIPNTTDYVLGGPARFTHANELRGDGYQDKLANVIHLRCKRGFDAKLIDIRQGNVECPHCRRSKPSVSHLIPEVRAAAVVGSRMAEVVDEPVTSDTPSPKTTKAVELKQFLSDNNLKLLEYDKSLASCTIQCLSCGAEMTKSIKVLSGNSGRFEGAICATCSKEQVDITKLKLRYLGKIYNGLRIEKIYTSEENPGETLCDVVCQQNKPAMSLQGYIGKINNPSTYNTKLSYVEVNSVHIKTGIPLGNVINNREWCTICGKEQVESASRYRGLMSSCPNIENVRISTRKDCKLIFKGITVGELLSKVKKGSLCDMCTAESFCKHARKDPRVSLGTIVSLMDMQDNILNEMLQLSTEHKGMFEFKQTDGSNVQLKPESGLMVIKDIYVGRDNNTYKACKCSRHGTELVLSDSEIASFDHTLCTKKNIYMQFFDIKRGVYLQK